jgi:hypothetical protein
VSRADKLSAICESIVYTIWDPRQLNPIGLHGLLGGLLYGTDEDELELQKILAKAFLRLVGISRCTTSLSSERTELL